MPQGGGDERDRGYDVFPPGSRWRVPVRVPRLTLPRIWPDLHVCLVHSLELPDWPDDVLEVVWRVLTQGVVVAR